MDQKRQYPRFALEAEVTLTADGRSASGRTSNLSRGGFCAMMPAPLPVGARVEVEIALVFDNESSSEPLRLPGRVVWCTAVEKQHQVGLSFGAISPEAGRYLDVFLRFLAEGKRMSRAEASGSGDPFDA